MIKKIFTVLAILLLSIILVGCSSAQEGQEKEELNIIGEVQEIGGDNSQKETGLPKNSDGNDEKIVESKTYNKMNQYRLDNNFPELLFDNGFEGGANFEIKRLVEAGVQDYEFYGDKSVIYGAIKYDSDVENCGNTLSSDDMSECIYNEVKDKLLTNKMNQIGFTVKFDSNSDNMYYFIFY